MKLRCLLRLHKYRVLPIKDQHVYGRCLGCGRIDTIGRIHANTEAG